MGQVKPFPVPEPGTALAAPSLLTDAHDLTGFDCGHSAMDAWLRKRALRNGIDGASRTFVVCSGTAVVGYYSLAVGSIMHSLATGKIRRNMPDPVPVMVLGRLAVDQRWQGQGIGSGMLRDAVLKTIHVSEYAGIRALLVHAIDQDAKRFYGSWGFHPSLLEPSTMMIALQEARKTLLGGGNYSL